MPAHASQTNLCVSKCRCFNSDVSAVLGEVENIERSEVTSPNLAIRDQGLTPKLNLDRLFVELEVFSMCKL